MSVITKPDLRIETGDSKENKSILTEIGITQDVVKEKGVEILRALSFPSDGKNFRAKNTLKNFLIEFTGSDSPIHCSERQISGKKFWVATTNSGKLIATNRNKILIHLKVLKTLSRDLAQSPSLKGIAIPNLIS